MCQYLCVCVFDESPSIMCKSSSPLSPSADGKVSGRHSFMDGASVFYSPHFSSSVPFNPSPLPPIPPTFCRVKARC